MLRQLIGLNSKRRDAEKINMVRDESGRMVLSKLERVTPDFKQLLAARSYLLKMMVEKVFTKKEIQGKGKRSQAYGQAITAYKHKRKEAQPDKDEVEEAGEEEMDLLQSIYEDSGRFYSRRFGTIVDIPKEVEGSNAYIESTPENVLKNVFLLGIDKDDIQLYWLARMMDCLPLPPNWFKKKGTSFDQYTYEPEKLKFDIHPSYFYVLRQMNHFKQLFGELGADRQNHYLGMRQVNFYDYFERKYTVDMYGYIQQAEERNREY